MIVGPNRRGPGLGLAYARMTSSDLVTTYAPNTLNGTATHFMPDRIPVFAARDGEIAHVGGPRGTHCVLVDHVNGWATYYSNLEHVFARTSGLRAPRREPVKAGDVLGYAGAGEGEFKSLDFELWKRGEEHFEPVDPEKEMTSWLVLPWLDYRLTPIEPYVSEVAA
ncbi:MAG: peptidoglycan DD-metalloendopeptidase family protein [Kofleriaceae bacterium]